MEYFQIEERFGRRPSPKLELYLESAEIGAVPFSRGTPARFFVLGLKNVGRGTAKFPSIRYRCESGLAASPYGIDDNGGCGLPRHPSENEWATFRGGVDQVVYPEEILKITRLFQQGKDLGVDGLPLPKVVAQDGRSLTQWVFKPVTFLCEISAEGVPTAHVEKVIPECSVVR